MVYALPDDNESAGQIGPLGVPRLMIRAALLIVLTAQFSFAGCFWQDRTVHRLCHLRATDYFTDPQVIALCEAIEADDLGTMQKLIDAGVDVDARGQANVTPLMWAYPNNKVARFRLLLEHGADPNVILTGHVGKPVAFSKGDAVTFMVCKSSFPEHFDLVFNHGGDPQLLDETGKTPIYNVIFYGADKLKRIDRLIELGSDVNHSAGRVICTPLCAAISFGGQYELAIELLQRGADPNRVSATGLKSAAHQVAEEYVLPTHSVTPGRKEVFVLLEEAKKDHGADFDQANRDIEEWAILRTNAKEGEAGKLFEEWRRKRNERLEIPHIPRFRH